MCIRDRDRDEQDKNALHVLGLDETGAARCTARVFADAPGVWHAGRIAVPVSYTHLDVYKRQACYRAAKKEDHSAQRNGSGFRSVRLLRVLNPDR